MFGFLKRKQQEERADPQAFAESDSLDWFLGDGTSVGKKEVLQLPAVKGCLEKIAGMVCLMPIRLYKKTEDGVTEITDDIRLKLLNDDPNDTLNSDEFWKAMLEDYFLGKGGFAYIEQGSNGVAGLHYVDEAEISIMTNNDPIWKDYEIMIRGKRYHPWEFFKIRKSTKDGMDSRTVWQEHPLIFEIAYNSMRLEKKLMSNGGNKKGFIESENRLTREAIDSIRTAWKRIYSNDANDIVVLNNGAKFKESSNTSVEMQLNESKKNNSTEICQLFGISPKVIWGGATAEDRKGYLDTCIFVINTIEKALNRDLLTEAEKGEMYFAFDTRKIVRGSQKERYEAYQIALNANFMQIDEVRKLEDLPSTGFDWLKIGLNDVLINPREKLIYTPNTNAKMNLNTEPKKGKKGGDEFEN